MSEAVLVDDHDIWLMEQLYRDGYTPVAIARKWEIPEDDAYRYLGLIPPALMAELMKPPKPPKPEPKPARVGVSWSDAEHAALANLIRRSMGRGIRPKVYEVRASMEREFGRKFCAMTIAGRIREACKERDRNDRLFTERDRRRFLRIASAPGRTLADAVSLFERATGKTLNHDTAAAWVLRAGREPMK